MFPLTITITNTDQLLRVMSALSLIETAHAVTTGVSANEKAAVLLATEAAMADTVSPAPVAEAPGKPSAATTAASPPTAEAAPSTSAPSPDASATSATPSAQPTAPAADAPSAADAKPFEYATLQRAVNERVTKLGKDKLLAIAQAHGAVTFKELPAAKWQAVYNDVVALGV